mmetsp:Transcript_2441/g.2549  ORF Transcript_2441/g.2549 Transcript_2441/m.2549 type:complete len:108 (-) Transcript_2441:49-372(-)
MKVTQDMTSLGVPSDFSPSAEVRNIMTIITHTISEITLPSSHTGIHSLELTRLSTDISTNVWKVKKRKRRIKSQSEALILRNIFDMIFHLNLFTRMSSRDDLHVIKN